MKKQTIIILITCGVVLAATLLTTHSQEATGQPRGSDSRAVFEYATARFMEEKTSIVWPDGKVESVILLNGGKKFDNGSEKYPKGADYRMYWLTVAMNIMARQGFEFVHMHDRDVVMKRRASNQ